MTKENEKLKLELQMLQSFKHDYQKIKRNNSFNYVNETCDLLKTNDIESFIKSGDLMNKSFKFVDDLMNKSMVQIDERIATIEAALKTDEQ